MDNPIVCSRRGIPMLFTIVFHAEIIAISCHALWAS